MIADPYKLVEEKLDRKSKRNVLITGCNGYLGIEMCHKFSQWDWDVYGVDPSTRTEDKRLTSFCQMSISELRHKPWDVDAIIHLAGASVADDRYEESYFLKNNVEATRQLRLLYPDTPIYFASTCTMYNDIGEIEHKHHYSRTKEAAEGDANMVFRMGSITGANRIGRFATVIDLMIDSAYKNGHITVAQGDKYRPVASIDNICESYCRSITSQQSELSPSLVITHLWDAVATIDDIGEAVAGLVGYTTGKEIEVCRQDDLSQIDKKQPRMSIIPPDCDITDQRRSTLLRVVQNAIERYEKYVPHERRNFSGGTRDSVDAADSPQAEMPGDHRRQTDDSLRV